jgi:hypothetical protein
MNSRSLSVGGVDTIENPKSPFVGRCVRSIEAVRERKRNKRSSGGDPRVHHMIELRGIGCHVCVRVKGLLKIAGHSQACEPKTQIENKEVGRCLQLTVRHLPGHNKAGRLGIDIGKETARPAFEFV